MIWLLIGTTALFAVAVAWVRRASLAPRHAALLIVAVGALLQLGALLHSPNSSDDVNRYVWDAKVQLSGVDPYRYPPSAPELDHLREPALFGPSSACTYPLPDGGCTAINRPTVHTIYPPVAEATFAAGRVLAAGHGGEFVYQLLAALGATGVGWLLARRVLRAGTAVWPVALWSWCPIVVFEFGNNAHIDWLAVLLSVLALQAGARRAAVLAGVLCGAAIATKLYPALILPSLMRRRPVLVAASAIATVVAVYLPHVIAVGGGVLGYLPGYLHEEGYNSGQRLLLLGILIPHPFDTIAGALVLAAATWWAWQHTDPDRPEQAATILTGAAFLVVTPNYGWYAALLVALVVMSARYEWMVLSFAPSVTYLVHHGTVVYAVAALGTLAAWFARRASAQDDARPSRRRAVRCAGAGRAVSRDGRRLPREADPRPGR